MHEPIKAHTAEVLRQVEGARVPYGGWVGGDSWFGSVASTAVEVYKRCNVHSTWIIKQNTTPFPMAELKSILTARYSSRPAGHWVTMHTEIAGVPLMAVAYAWSQRGISYFLSTCGSSRRSPIEYMSRFEDEFGNTSFKVLSRPRVCHFLLILAIDEHNRQRQSFCALEKCWPATSNCWFRLLTTVVGMSLVDMNLMHRYHITGRSIACSSVFGGDDCLDRSNLCTVINFCNRVSGGLSKRIGLPATHRNMTERYRAPGDRIVGPVVAYDPSGGNGVWWERIPNYQGQIRAACVTHRQIEKHGRTMGTSVQRNCWVCRKYVWPTGLSLYNKTTFQCVDCKRPICINEDRSCSELGRMMSCRDEHRYGNCPATGCINVNRVSAKKLRGKGRDSSSNEEDDGEEDDEEFGVAKNAIATARVSAKKFRGKGRDSSSNEEEDDGEEDDEEEDGISGDGC